MQVGSKNAAFYLGRRIKVATRHTGSNYVHELSIGASDLEQRYRDKEVGVLGSRQAASDLIPGSRKHFSVRRSG